MGFFGLFKNKRPGSVDGKEGMMWWMIAVHAVKRISLTLILLVLVVLGIWAYRYYGRKYEFADKERLERITGVAYPDFRIVSYLHGGFSFNGDYSDKVGIEFEEAPSADFYRCLDSLATVKGSHWSKQKDGTYSFRYIWGNGFPAPRGESDKEDRHIHVGIKKGAKQAEIHYGAW